MSNGRMANKCTHYSSVPYRKNVQNIQPQNVDSDLPLVFLQVWSLSSIISQGTYVSDEMKIWSFLICRIHINVTANIYVQS